MGISYTEFLHMTPKKLNYCLKGYRLKQNMKDAEAYSCVGNYVLSAIIYSLDHVLNGRKAKTEYPSEPVSAAREKNEKEDYLRKQRELFVAKLKIMKSNYDLSHPKDGGE